MIHSTQNAHISQKHDEPNLYVIIKTICPSGYHDNIYIYTYVYTYIYMYVYIYIYKFILYIYFINILYYINIDMYI